MATEQALLRVKGTASVPALASAISHAVYDSKEVTLRAIGASAVSQAVKAVAVARGYVAPRGIDLSYGSWILRRPDARLYRDPALTLRSRCKV